MPHFSGLCLNKSKSSIINIYDGTTDENISDIPWTNSNVKILGVYFGDKEEKLIDHYWSPKLTKIQNIICSWKARHLTLPDKVIIIKSFLVSQIICYAQMM